MPDVRLSIKSQLAQAVAVEQCLQLLFPALPLISQYCTGPRFSTPHESPLFLVWAIAQLYADGEYFLLFRGCSAMLETRLSLFHEVVKL